MSVPGKSGSEGSFPIPRLEIEPPATVLEAGLPPGDPRERWLDSCGTVCLWATVHDDRPSLVAPGCALYELRDDCVRATPFRERAEGLVEDVYWRSVLPLVLQSRGVQALHASAVVGPSGVVAICGRSGSGKSTTAFGLSRRGYRLWSDDAVVVSSVEPPRTAALAGVVRLLPDVREHFQVTSTGLPLGCEIGEEQNIAMIVVLRPNPAAPGTGPRPLASGEALTAVVEHAYCYNFETAKRDLASDYLRLLAGVPVVEIGRPRGLDGLESFLDVIEGLLTADPG